MISIENQLFHEINSEKIKKYELKIYMLIISPSRILILKLLFTKIPCSFISSRMVFLPKFILSPYDLKILSLIQPRPIVPFLPCDVEANSLFSRCIHR